MSLLSRPLRTGLGSALLAAMAFTLPGCGGIHSGIIHPPSTPPSTLGPMRSSKAMQVVFTKEFLADKRQYTYYEWWRVGTWQYERSVTVFAHHSRPIRSAHEIRTYAGCDDRLLGPQRALIDRRIVLSEVPLPDFFSMRKGLLESNLGLTQLVCAVETLIDAP